MHFFPRIAPLLQENIIFASQNQNIQRLFYGLLYTPEESITFQNLTSMQPVIYPVEKEKIISELTEDRFMRKTNKAGNEIYTFDSRTAPNLMKEVGRIRELTFRSAGGGTGKEIDIDEFDIAENTPYQQLIVWDPKEKEILGGYRYILCDHLAKNAEGEPNLATTELFRFSENFKQRYLPRMIELGRSFVHPLYQSTKMGRKSVFALDNLWDGLGALTVDHPEIEYFFGKVTMYTSFNIQARNMLLYFMKKYFRDTEKLVEPILPLEIEIDELQMQGIFVGNTYEEDYKILSYNVRELGENIPPLVNAYMSLSPSMKTFGTAINPGFGGVEETAILIKIADVYEAKKKRHIATYIPNLLSRLKNKR